MSFYDGTQDDETILENFEPLPDGDYLCNIAEVGERVSQKNPNVEYYGTEFEVIKGDHAGRKIYGNFVYKHHNEKAVNIGRARMKQLCIAAVGTARIDRAEQLFGKTVTVRIRTKPDKRTGEPSTNVTGIGGPQGIAKKGSNPAPAPGVQRTTQSFAGTNSTPDGRQYPPNPGNPPAPQHNPLDDVPY